MTFLEINQRREIFVLIIDLMTTVFCRSTYVEGFFVPIFDLITFFGSCVESLRHRSYPVTIFGPYVLSGGP